MHLDTDPFDLLVIGAGPAGISTAVEAHRAGLSHILLLEKGPSHSFSIEKMYPAGKRVDRAYLGQDLPCQGTVCIVDGTRETVLDTLDAFVREYALPVQYDTEVVRIQHLEDGFDVEDHAGRHYRSRTVVLAIGVFGRPKRPDYPLPASLRAAIHFDLTQGIPAGASVLVVGGGNSALEYAAFLAGSHPLTLAYRGLSFTRANEVNRAILSGLESTGQVEVLRGTDIQELRDAGGAPRVEALFRDGRTMRADHVLYALGGSTPEAFLHQAGVELEGRHPSVDASLHSRVPGLFLAGDLVASGRGSLVKAFNTGRTVVWEGLCRGHLACRIPRP